MVVVEDPIQAWVSSLQAIIEARLPLVVVEGATDKRCLMRCFEDHHRDIQDQVKCEFFQGNPVAGQLNKRLVFDAMKALNTLSPDSNHAIGIVDADFMRAMTKSGRLAESRYIKNVFFTDAHDLDCQIFQSRALDSFVSKYLVEYGDNANELRERCLKPAAELGYLKLSLQINKLHHLREKFRDIVEFINPQFEIDGDLVHSVMNNCITQGLITQEQADQFFMTVAGLQSGEIDPWQLANGHDLFHVLGLLIIVGEIHLRHRGLIRYRQDDLLLNTDARKYFAHRLEHHVRKFYDLACFKASGLYRTICNHQDRTQVFFVEGTADIYESIAYITRGMVFKRNENLIRFFKEEALFTPKQTKTPKFVQDIEAGTPPPEKKHKATMKKKRKKNKQAMTQQKSAKSALQGVILSEDEEIRQFLRNLTSISILSNDKDKTHFCTTARNTCLTRFQAARTQTSSLPPETERSAVLLLFSLVALLAWLSQKTPLMKKDYKSWVQTHLLKGNPPTLSGDEKRHLSSVIYDAIHLNFGKENIQAKNIKMVESNANFLIRPQDGSFEVNLWVLYDQLDKALSKFCMDLRNPNNLLSIHFLRKMLQLKIAYGPLSPR